MPRTMRHHDVDVHRDRGHLRGLTFPEHGHHRKRVGGAARRADHAAYRDLPAIERYGTSVQRIVELLPHIGGIADDIYIARSMTAERINHDGARIFMDKGFRIPGRPSMGSWITDG